MTTRPRYIALEAWEASALIAGAMTQKRVPIDHWRYAPRPGSLIWVQEPFVQWVGAKQQAQCAIGFRADAGPGSVFPDQPAFLKNVHTKFTVHIPSEMRAGDSRLTLEVTDTQQRRHPTAFSDGDEEAEALPTLCIWEKERDQYLAFRAFWNRRFGAVAPVLIVKFRVHATQIGQLIKQREAS